MHDPSDLAEQAAWDKLKAISDEGLSDTLAEMSGDIGGDEFMLLLQEVRHGNAFKIGMAFKNFAHSIIYQTIDGSELARQADEDARAEAADDRREHRRDIGR